MSCRLENKIWLDVTAPVCIYVHLNKFEERIKKKKTLVRNAKICVVT